MRVIVPPIKCQGIKTKLVPFLRENVYWWGNGRWVEPFMGSGVVGFNMQPEKALFCDTNPHIIRFYQAINHGEITSEQVRAFLEEEGSVLQEQGKAYYYTVRERFNETYKPLDFLFLSRAGFNGMMRFNSKGKFNVPFNHKPKRFAKAYVTKVVNQVQAVSELCQFYNWQFACQDFRETLANVKEADFVYCDPPYAGRHTDYYNDWQSESEEELIRLLEVSKANIMLSTWHSNHYRANPIIAQLEKHFTVLTREHFYHVGAHEKNRQPILEAVAINYEPVKQKEESVIVYEQLHLLESQNDYET